MTQHDLGLIAEAETLHFTRWNEVTDLIDRAESQEAKNRLHVIKSMLFHREEYEAGML